MFLLVINKSQVYIGEVKWILIFLLSLKILYIFLLLIWTSEYFQELVLHKRRNNIIARQIGYVVVVIIVYIIIIIIGNVDNFYCCSLWCFSYCCC